MRQTGWLLLSLLSFSLLAANVRESGAVGDGKADDTAAVQAILNRGPGTVVFPAGTYRLGMLRVGSGQRLRFEPDAVWLVEPGEGPAQAAAIAGGEVELRDVRFDLSRLGKPEGKAKAHTLFQAEKVRGLRLTGAVIVRPHEGRQPVGKHQGWQSDVVVLSATECRDVEVDHCRAENVRTLVQTEFCENVSVHENRAEWCEHISLFRNGSREVRHYANWSRNVVFQCMWWGGDANDMHKWIKDHTSNVVRPDLKPGDEGYDPSTAGVYGVSVQNNYAEYGVTLSWGAKARNVVVTGNTAKYMEDMAYDSEGDENVVIANNLSVNSKCAGIGCYFWTDKVLIAGNQLLVLDEDQELYQGNFIRLHSGGQAGPDRFGTGKCLVQGNLLVAEVAKPRALLIEACRDVTISGNKFVNGRINTNPWDQGRRIVVTDNEFQFHGGEAVNAIEVVSKGVMAVVKGNLLNWEHAGTPEGKDAPAILVRGTGERDQTVLQNLAQGWPTAIQCEVAEPTDAGPRFILRDNTVDGAVLLPPSPPACRVVEQGTLNLSRQSGE